LLLTAGIFFGKSQVKYFFCLLKRLIRKKEQRIEMPTINQLLALTAGKVSVRGRSEVTVVFTFREKEIMPTINQLVRKGRQASNTKRQSGSASQPAENAAFAPRLYANAEKTEFGFEQKSRVFA
jgi:hypothetical protein